MSLDLNQKITINWTPQNKNRLVEAGYEFTGMRTSIQIKASELSKGSKVIVELKCDNCGAEKTDAFQNAIKRKNHFCSQKCRGEYHTGENNPQYSMKDVECCLCEKPFKVKNYQYEQYVNGDQDNIFCSISCKNTFSARKRAEEQKELWTEHTCEVCEEPYKVPLHRKDITRFCSEECRLNRGKKLIKLECRQCGTDVFKTPFQAKRNESGNVFCSNKCVGKYNSYRHEENRIEKECLICEEKYKVIPSQAEKSVTCSVECQHIWQSKYLVGENANNYKKNVTEEMRTVNCLWCNKPEQVKPFKLKQMQKGKTRHFCSTECRQDWYRNEWSQSEEWKEESRIRAVKMLEEKVFKTETSCQIKLDEILQEMEISFINEYNCKYVSIDNYLSDYNLMIEVMGTYWHTDPRIYSEINYQMQVDRIKNDKIKNTYIKNNYGIQILYLWESDIENDSLLVQELIKEYITTEGELDNYHSFNYQIDENGELKKNIDLVIPYQEYSIDDLRKIIEFKTKPRSQKQTDKWITYDCEQCGEEKEQLIVRYNKAKHHFCSQTCRHKWTRGKKMKEIMNK